ncbi:MAG: hypothetical protein KDC44_09760, partial [Phaeodactylibacter sp.]|nr:hypothetical protein [Phaeodactylibacter sp.]
AGDRWWNQEIGVGPVNIPATEFSSKAVFSLQKIVGTTPGEENAITATVVSKNMAKSLWGSQVTATNGHAAMNAPTTIDNTFAGLELTPIIWHPLQTLVINIYELLFQDGNDLYWPQAAAPAVGTNNFEEQISSDGNTMTFQQNGQTVTSEYRQLNAQAFSQLATGQSIIQDLENFGITGLSVSTDANAMAAVMYKDWTVLALLGEEDEAAANPIH